MGEGKPSSTPTTPATHTGSDHATQGANTNLSATFQGGPTTPGDRAATQQITEQEGAGQEAQGGLPAGMAAQSDPARTMDNSGMLRPTGQGEDAEIMGSSGVDDEADQTDQYS
mgnify:CR=1 FL=1